MVDLTHPIPEHLTKLTSLQGELLNIEISTPWLKNDLLRGPIERMTS